MNKILTLIFAILFLAAFITSVLLNNSLLKVTEQLKQSENNTKALLFTKDSLNNSNRALKLSIEQLNYFNDSISKAFNVGKISIKSFIVVSFAIIFSDKYIFLLLFFILTLP